MNSIEWTTKAGKRGNSRHPCRERLPRRLIWPHVEQVKTLVGKPGYRLRVGRYRVLFTIHAGIPLVVRIEEVKKRDEHTY